MFTQGIRAICAAASFVGGLLILGQSQAADTTNVFTTRSGVIGRFAGIDETVQACTTSKTFVQIPSMARTFTIGAGAATPVVVTFSATVSIVSTVFDHGFVRLTIDGVEQTPGVVPFISTPNSATGEQAHAFTWQTQPLAAGVHTARVHWRTDFGSSVCVQARSLVVLYR